MRAARPSIPYRNRSLTGMGWSFKGMNPCEMPRVAMYLPRFRKGWFRFSTRRQAIRGWIRVSTQRLRQKLPLRPRLQAGPFLLNKAVQGTVGGGIVERMHHLGGEVIAQGHTRHLVARATVPHLVARAIVPLRRMRTVPPTHFLGALHVPPEDDGTPKVQAAAVIPTYPTYRIRPQGTHTAGMAGAQVLAAEVVAHSIGRGAIN